LHHIVVTPNPADVAAGGTQPFTAAGYDVNDNVVSITPEWSTDAGTISGSGVLTAQTTVVSGRHVTATVGGMTGTVVLPGVTGTAVVNVVAGGLDHIIVAVNPIMLMVNSGATASITATVQDTYGNPISGITLYGSVSPYTLGSVSELGVTNAKGQVFGTWTAGIVAGVGTLSVGNGSITSTAAITLNNPAPAITSLSPTTVTVGGPAFTLVVTGTNFVSDSTVYWNGSAHATTFVNSGRLDAAILTSDIMALGQIGVTVVNPAPGGGTSNTLFFTVVIRPPTMGDYKLYLPLVARNYASGPDLGGTNHGQ